MFLLNENSDYNSDKQLELLHKRLQNHLNTLIRKATNEFLNSSNSDGFRILNNVILNLNDLKQVIYTCKLDAIIFAVLRKCDILLPVNIEQHIKDFNDLKSIISMIDKNDTRSKALIFHALEPTYLGRLAINAEQVQYFLNIFSLDCRNRLMKFNCKYFASLINSDDEFAYFITSPLHDNQLTQIILSINYDTKITLIDNMKILSCLVENGRISVIFNCLPRMIRVRALHNASIQEKITFIQNNHEVSIRNLFKNLTREEWQALFTETSDIQAFIYKLKNCKNKFINAIPIWVKLAIYVEQINNNHELVEIKTKFSCFYDLKVAINNLLNPSLANYWLAFNFWKTKSKVLPDVENIQDLKIKIVDHFLLTGQEINFLHVEKLCAEYQTAHTDISDYKLNLR